MAGKLLTWTITHAAARVEGTTLIVSGIVTGPDGKVQYKGAEKSLRFTAAQLRNANVNLDAYVPNDAASIVTVTRPESEAKRGRKRATGQAKDTLLAFLNPEAAAKAQAKADAKATAKADRDAAKVAQTEAQSGASTDGATA